MNASVNVEGWKALADQWRLHPRLESVTRKVTLSVQLESDVSSCYLLIAAGQIRLVEGSHVRPDFVLEGQEEAIDQVLRGRVDITQPISKGQLRVARGPFLQALALSRIFGGLAFKEGSAK
jgi:putative sterol carrier protein